MPLYELGLGGRRANKVVVHTMVEDTEDGGGVLSDHWARSEWIA